MADRKAIFISGGGSGIGRAIAIRFGREGWFVGLGDIDPDHVVTPSIFVDRIVEVADPVSEAAALLEKISP